MAKKRYINTKFWSDTFIVELNPLERYLFMYLLTNEHTDICGIYELPWTVMARESGIDDETLKKIFKRLNGKVYYLDGWIYIKNFVKHLSANPKVEEGIKRSKESVPLEVMAKVSKIDIGYDRLSKPTIGPEVPKPKPKPKPTVNATITSPEKWSFVEQVEKMAKDESDKRMWIIALYWVLKHKRIESKAEYSQALRRELRVAGNLTAYPHDRLKETMTWLEKNADFKWTLETVSKYVDENLNNLNQKKVKVGFIS